MSFYLDEAATTKPKSEVIEAMLPYITEKWHNPSSLYSDSTYASIAIDNARKTVAQFINANSNEIYFTSGGSESNCWAIQGFVNNRIAQGRVPCIITTPIEHKSIMECVKNVPFAAVYYLDVDEYGFVSVDEINDAISSLVEHGTEPSDILVSVQFANNEIGTIQDIASISNIVHLYGCTLHTDAVQAFGHTFIDVDMMGIDMLSASAHKIGGCKGTGFLYVKEDIEINPIIYGSQMDGMRGGTENVAGIVGMAKAVQIINNAWTLRGNSRAIMTMNRDYFIDKLIAIGCKLNGPRCNRLPNNINVVLPHNINGETLLYALDVDNIQISTGSACNSHSINQSYVLKSIGLTDNKAQRSVRITVPDDITIDDIDYVVESIDSAIHVLRNINDNNVNNDE